MAKVNVETLRAALAKCLEEENEVRQRMRAAQKRTRAAGRALVTALAESAAMDFSDQERRALGLPKAGK